MAEKPSVMCGLFNAESTKSIRQHYPHHVWMCPPGECQTPAMGKATSLQSQSHIAREVQQLGIPGKYSESTGTVQCSWEVPGKGTGDLCVFNRSSLLGTLRFSDDSLFPRNRKSIRNKSTPRSKTPTSEISCQTKSTASFHPFQVPGSI